MSTSPSLRVSYMRRIRRRSRLSGPAFECFPVKLLRCIFFEIIEEYRKAFVLYEVWIVTLNVSLELIEIKPIKLRIRIMFQILNSNVFVYDKNIVKFIVEIRTVQKDVFF